MTENHHNFCDVDVALLVCWLHIAVSDNDEGLLVKDRRWTRGVLLLFLAASTRPPTASATRSQLLFVLLRLDIWFGDLPDRLVRFGLHPDSSVVLKFSLENHEPPNLHLTDHLPVAASPPDSYIFYLRWKCGPPPPPDPTNRHGQYECLFNRFCANDYDDDTISSFWWRRLRIFTKLASNIHWCSDWCCNRFIGFSAPGALALSRSVYHWSLLVSQVNRSTTWFILSPYVKWQSASGWAR